jgi:threonine dehydrogenase-like Zn-dependent dehydrogenase
VIAIDHYPHRLELARSLGAEILDYEEVKVREALVEMTGGIGPDACIEVSTCCSQPTLRWMKRSSIVDRSAQPSKACSATSPPRRVLTK